MNTSDLIVWLEERLDRLESKLDRAAVHGANVDLTLAKQAKDLEYHIKRTDLLESRVEQVADDVRPIKQHVQQLRGIAWFVGTIIVGTIGVFATLAKLIDR